MCVPLSTMRPSSSTRTLSACRMVLSRCAMTKLVRSFSSVSSACWMRDSVMASTELVASSRMKIWGFASMARTKQTSCRCPRERPVPPSPPRV